MEVALSEDLGSENFRQKRRGEGEGTCLKIQELLTELGWFAWDKRIRWCALEVREMVAKNECNYSNCKWSLPALWLLRGHGYTKIWGLLHGKSQGSVPPLDFFPSTEAVPGEHQVVCRVGAAFVIWALPKSGPTMLLGWFFPLLLY